ncbi:MAG: tetratricopeptide repeat protein [Candidatus Eremiobacteraeota bacterium]|nr:tetratricopeptide repeat protein [Candidatus Eremiobacteraeota bacterium]
MVKAWAAELAGLYSQFDEVLSTTLPGAPENPCETCRNCCSYPIHLQVSALERDFIKEQAPPGTCREEAFIAFINRAAGESGSPAKVCPHYDCEGMKCLIYLWRPLCCRMFGHVPFRSVGKGCPYGASPARQGTWKRVEALVQAFSALRLQYYRACRDSLTPLTAMDFLIMGNVSLDEGDPRKAFLLYDEALQRFPDSALVRSYQARKYELMEHLPEAEREYRAAIALDPEEPVLLVKLGFVKYGMSDFQGAVVLYREAIRRDGSNHMAWANMGLAFLSLNEYEHALDAYEHALALEPSPTLLIMKGNILDCLARSEEALEAYQGALALDGEDLLAHMCLGKIHRKLSFPEKARFHYEKAMALAVDEGVKKMMEGELATLALPC